MPISRVFESVFFFTWTSVTLYISRFWVANGWLSSISASQTYHCVYSQAEQDKTAPTPQSDGNGQLKIWGIGGLLIYGPWKILNHPSTFSETSLLLALYWWPTATSLTTPLSPRMSFIHENSLTCLHFTACSECWLCKVLFEIHTFSLPKSCFPVVASADSAPLDSLVRKIAIATKRLTNRRSHAACHTDTCTIQSLLYRSDFTKMANSIRPSANQI